MHDHAVTVDALIATLDASVETGLPAEQTPLAAFAARAIGQIIEASHGLSEAAAVLMSAAEVLDQGDTSGSVCFLMARALEPVAGALACQDVEALAR